MRRSMSESEVRGRWCERAGWGGLLLWLVGGLVLESFHGLKAPLYLEDALRRQMWTLAHAHGTLLSALCLVLPLTRRMRELAWRHARRADVLRAVGSQTVALGFVLGGAWHSEGDPGIAIFLVPAGGIAFAAAIVIAVTGERERGDLI